MSIDKDKLNSILDYFDAIISIIKPSDGYTLILNRCKELDGISISLSTDNLSPVEKPKPIPGLGD